MSRHDYSLLENSIWKHVRQFFQRGIRSIAFFFIELRLRSGKEEFPFRAFFSERHSWRAV